jgi:hypothetical protein
MAKRSNQPGKGVKSLRLEDRIKEAADDLRDVCDGVVIVCVKFGETHDNDETIMRASRGPRMLVGKAIDMLCEYDDSLVEIKTFDEEDDD